MRVLSISEEGLEIRKMERNCELKKLRNPEPRSSGATAQTVSREFRRRWSTESIERVEEDVAESC